MNLVIVRLSLLIALAAAAIYIAACQPLRYSGNIETGPADIAKKDQSNGS